MNASISDLMRRASPETQHQIKVLLRQDADDAAWAEQLGPAYRQVDVARLLGKSRQAVSADHGLLRLEMRDGEIGYPVFQFEGRRQLPGVRQVVGLLGPVVASPWTLASWLTSASAALDGQSPIQALRKHKADAVTALARQTAEALAH
ncbi:MAG: hypothetical protein RQ741_00450 [Wenzhouxiangellaceae bacterium]|nr:hypothetical protein [Wenzhouxiangellaceae bacterium]